jgi:hypothetical protein
MNSRDFIKVILKKNNYGIGPIGENQSPTATRATVRLIYMWWLNSAWPENRKHPLSRLLNDFDRAEARVPHDNMFALLGLSRESYEPTLAPDYEQTPEETLLRYARHFLFTKQSIGILSSSGLSQRSSLSSTPSWIPLWTSSMRESRLSLYQPDGTPYFHAGGNATPQLSIIEDNKILEVAGLIIDTLSVVHNSRWFDTYHSSGASSYQYMFETFGDADDISNDISNHTEPPFPQELQDAKWRNLLRDMVWEWGPKFPPPAEW